MIIVTALNEGKKRTTWEAVSCNYLLLFTGSSRPGAVFGLLGQPVDALLFLETLLPFLHRCL